MPGYDPQAAAQKQIKRAQNSTQEYRDGVSRVTESPTAKAAQKLDKYQQGVLDALNSGKTRAALEAVSTEDWKRATLGKGASRYSSGVQDAADKIVNFHSQLSAFMAGHKAEMDRMPDATAEDRINKMVANVRGMSKFKYRKGMR